MRVGIDLAPLTYTLTGIGVYVQSLVETVCRLDDTVCWRFPVLSELPWDGFFRWRMRSQISPSLQDRIEIAPKFALLHDRRQKRAPCRLAAANMRLFHVTNAQSQFDEFDLPMVITVHDLAWMRVDREEMPAPRIFGLNRLESLIRKAQHVICDSECTRQDVLELIGRNPGEVSTIHLAQRPWCIPPGDEQDRVAVRQLACGGRPYFLAISTIEPRKNYVRLVKAFAQVKQKFPDHELIIVGAKRSAWPQVQRTVRELKLDQSIHARGHVSNEQILGLMWGCEALIYPSLYEGFGLPALEAMACGAPVVCSTAGSLGEVVGQAAIIVDPLDIESIANGMQQIAESPENLEQRRKASLANAARFSWSKTAEKTLSVYRQIAQ